MARNYFVATWVQYFYKWCIPPCLTYADVLITGRRSQLSILSSAERRAAGLPSPKMGCGILAPAVLPSERKVLGRPLHARATVPSPTGMIEDIAAVAERYSSPNLFVGGAHVASRYQLAKWLDVAPNSIPRTDFKARRVIDDREVFRSMNALLQKND